MPFKRGTLVKFVVVVKESFRERRSKEDEQQETELKMALVRQFKDVFAYSH